MNKIETAGVKINEAKLIFVGEGGVGKTTLANTLINQEQTTDGTTTFGIKITDWNVKSRNDSISIKIWDFGGQEIYHSTHQFFLTDKSVYVFVWDSRRDSSFTSFDYWLNIISMLASKSPIIIVQNKIDERLKMIDESNLKNKFPNIVEFINVSAKEHIGTTELRNTIIKQIRNLPQIGTVIPKSWDRIKKEILKNQADYLSNNEFQQICFKNDLTVTQATFLSQYLHDSGNILHFQDDLILKEIIIIDPTWLTNAIYHILDSNDIQSKNGRIEIKELNSILEKSYGTTNYFILAILIKFELAFKLNENEIVFSELLPLTPPTFEWDFKDSLTFQYRYDFMPKGVITRFISRIYNPNSESIYWKNGIIIKNFNSEALIESDTFNRIIKINVRGNESKQLFTNIRDHFDYINASYSDLYVHRLTPCNCENCKSSTQPYFFELDFLELAKEKGRKSILCQSSLLEVSIDNLIDTISKQKAELLEENISKEESIEYEWIEENNLNFEYQHNFNKKSVLEKFNKRISSVLGIEKQWADGLILQRENNKALIVNDVIKNKIKLSITGLDNLEMLSVLRYEFDHIYNHYFNRDYEEVIKCTCPECSNNNDSHYFDFTLLRKRKTKGKELITCPISAEDVNLSNLFGQDLFNAKTEEYSSPTIYKEVYIGHSDEVNFGTINKKTSNMKIKKVKTKDSQNIFADHIDNSEFNYTATDRQLLEWIEKYSISEKEQQSLLESIEVLKGDKSTKQKLSAKEKVEAFLFKNSESIGQSLVASTLFEIGKNILG